jgi:hypothetical protein
MYHQHALEPFIVHDQQALSGLYAIYLANGLHGRMAAEKDEQ